MNRTLFARIASLAILLSVPARMQAQWDAANDFSLGANPNGVWTYGIRSSIASTALSVYSLAGLSGSQAFWSDVSYAAPGVFENVGGSTAIYYGTVSMTPGQLAFHPGPAGELSIIRFTAPTAGNYSVATSFIGVDFASGGTTTDVHVVVDGTAVFNGMIGGFGDTDIFTAILTLGSGSVVDFAVGYGNGSWFDDSTGIEAVITTATSTPEPSSLVLLGTALVALMTTARRRTRRSE